MEIFLAFLIGACLLSGYFSENTMPPDKQAVITGTELPLKSRLTVSPLRTIQTENMIPQTYDYSCGSSALATILRFHFGENISEKEVIRGLLTFGDKKQIMEIQAFSLLDMKNYLASIGYEGNAYTAEIDDLKKEENLPCIVPVVIHGYNHFIVLKNFFEGHVLVSDPSRGNISFTRKTFESIWQQKVVFIVSGNTAPQRSYLKISDKDLAFIREDAARHTVLKQHPSFQLPEEIRITNIPGKRQNIKP